MILLLIADGKVVPPEGKDVIGLRERVGVMLGMTSITEAQDRCALLVHTSRRSWQQWERKERNMHLAFWELVNIKASELVS
jgi:hypothetical protein